MVGWVKGAGRFGSDPEGGARFIAGPEGTSGIEDGGTGGGRSENIWAETAAGISKASASATGGKSRIAPPEPPLPLPREAIGMLFTENAANSSLCSGLNRSIVVEPGAAPNVNAAAVVPSPSLPSSVRRA